MRSRQNPRQRLEFRKAEFKTECENAYTSIIYILVGCQSQLCKVLCGKGDQLVSGPIFLRSDA